MGPDGSSSSGAGGFGVFWWGGGGIDVHVSWFGEDVRVLLNKREDKVKTSLYILCRLHHVSTC